MFCGEHSLPVLVTLLGEEIIYSMVIYLPN